VFNEDYDGSICDFQIAIRLNTNEPLYKNNLKLAQEKLQKKK